MCGHGRAVDCVSSRPGWLPPRGVCLDSALRAAVGRFWGEQLTPRGPGVRHRGLRSEVGAVTHAQERDGGGSVRSLGFILTRRFVGETTPGRAVGGRVGCRSVRVTQHLTPLCLCPLNLSLWLERTCREAGRGARSVAGSQQPGLGSFSLTGHRSVLPYCSPERGVVSG